MAVSTLARGENMSSLNPKSLFIAGIRIWTSSGMVISRKVTIM